MFSREDYEIFKNTYFGEHLRLNILQNILQNISLLLLLYFYYLHASNSSFQYFSKVSISLYFENIIQKSNLYYSNSAILEDIRDIYSLKFFIYGSPVQFMPEGQPRV